MNTEESFTTQRPFVVTTEKLAGFSKHRRFICKLCGTKFKVGDTARWIYSNGTPNIRTGNFFVCQNCDIGNEGCMIKAKESLELAITLGKQWGLIE